MMGSASSNHGHKKNFSGGSFCRDCNQAIRPQLLIMRGVWPGEEARLLHDRCIVRQQSILVFSHCFA